MNKAWARQKSDRRATSIGFTIVELLIVIVVIAILAAITIVAYNGIQERARASEVSSALSQAAKKIKVWQVDSPETTPATLATVGVANSGNVKFQYKPGVSGAFCITATSGTTSFKVTENSSPVAGGCAGHGQGGIDAVTNLATNPSFETGSGWLSNNTPIYPIAVENTITKSGNQSRTGWNENGSNVLVTLYSVGSADHIGIPISEGGTYTYSYYFRAEVPHYAYVRGSYRLGSVYHPLPTGETVVGQAGQWSRVSHTFTVPEGADRLRMGADISSSSVQPTGTRGYVDDAMLVKGGSNYGYADGNSPNWEWSGTPQASSSTGPAL